MVYPPGAHGTVASRFALPSGHRRFHKKTAQFAIDTLVEMLSRVGKPVRLTIGGASTATAPQAANRTPVAAR
jgi:hypothetical protein